MANLLEYALGGDPADADSAPRPVLTVSSLPTDPAYLQLTFLRSAPNVTYSVEGSSTLAPDSWIAVPFTLSAIGELSTATDPEPVTNKRFLRLRVTTP